jgi:hypothetical protein
MLWKGRTGFANKSLEALQVIVDMHIHKKIGGKMYRPTRVGPQLVQRP